MRVKTQTNQIQDSVLFSRGETEVPRYCNQCKSAWLYYDDCYMCDKKNILVDINERACESFDPERRIKRRIYDPSAYYPEADEVHEFYLIRHLPE